MDSEQQARVLLIGAVVGVIAIALGFIAFGYWYSVIKPRNRTVLQYEDVKVSYAAMKRRMEYEFTQNTNFQTQQGINLLPVVAYQNVIDEITRVKHAGDRLDVQVTDDEFQKKLRSRIGVSDTADERTFNDQFKNALDTSGLNESEYRRLALAEAFDEKINTKFTAEIPQNVPMVKAEVIAVGTKDEAQKAIDRINGGEDFAAVAKQVSLETNKDTTGGLYDYAPKGTWSADYESYLFSTNDIGKLSAPLQGSGSSANWYVIRVDDRSDQPVQDSQKGKITAARLDDWLKSTEDELGGQGKITRSWDATTQKDALTAVFPALNSRLTAQQRKQSSDATRAATARETTIAQLTASPQAVQTPGPGGTAQPSGGTPAADTNPPPGNPADQGGSPAAPSQPVAPSNNGP